MAKNIEEKAINKIAKMAEKICKKIGILAPKEGWEEWAKNQFCEEIEGMKSQLEETLEEDLEWMKREEYSEEEIKETLQFKEEDSLEDLVDENNIKEKIQEWITDRLWD